VASEFVRGYPAVRVYEPQRRFFVGMAVVAAACFAVPLALDATDLTLCVMPALLIFGLLLCGRYVGEERILARRSAVQPRTRRAARRIARPASERSLLSLFARRELLERGPPAPDLLLTA
jgi:hypothetical protein